jgi:predicted Zn-dependent peptidase
MAVVDAVIAEACSQPIDQATLDRALVKLRSDFYDNLSGFFGFGRADLLASFALFDDNPERINQLEAQFRQVTPELILQTAKEYLRPTARTVLTVEPKTTS